MINWIYSNPTWLWGGALVIGVTVLSCLALAVLHRFVDAEIRRHHNDVMAAAMGIVGVAYAVLLAFVAVAAWESFSGGNKIVDTEASFVADLYRQTIGLPETKGGPLKDTIRKYLDQVVDEEFPAQRRGEMSQAGRPTLVSLQAMIARIDPNTPGETVISTALMQTMNGLYAARRTRTLAADDSIPEVVWWITAFGTTLTIGFTFLFGTRNFSMHLAMTGMVAASMSLVIVLIMSLDRPFRGELSVSTQAYENARGSIAAVDALLKAPPH